MGEKKRNQWAVSNGICRPFTTAMMNLNMLLETYGKHRSAVEYTKWLNEIGFRNCKIVRSSGEKHMIVAFK